MNFVFPCSVWQPCLTPQLGRAGGTAGKPVGPRASWASARLWSSCAVFCEPWLKSDLLSGRLQADFQSSIPGPSYCYRLHCSISFFLTRGKRTRGLCFPKVGEGWSAA